MYTQLIKKTSWGQEQDYILQKNEMGYDTKNKVLKIGNGVDKWADLAPAISLSLADSYSGESTVDGNVEDADEQSAVIINFLNKKIRELLPGQKALLLTQGKTLSDNLEIIANKSYIKPSGTKEVTTNGAYDVKQFEKVDVNVKPNLQEKIITENGEYMPDDGYDGLSKVEVNVSGSIANFYDGTVQTSGVISFLVGTAYAFTAEEGMTWAQWLESEYNTGGYFFSEGAHVVAWSKAGVVLVPYNPEDVWAQPDDCILFAIHSNIDTDERQDLDSVIVNLGRYVLRNID